MKRLLRRILVGGAAMLVPAVAAHAQATGTIAGRVTDRATQQPIADAQVLIVGTTRRARTSDAGQYRLTGVPAGTVRVRVLRLGYEADTRTLSITGNETVTEAQFRAGTPGPAMATLNAIRAIAGLAPLADPGNDIARTNLLFRERAFWMWGTAHRLGDMRRLVRQYSRTQETVFPVGEYHKGGEYGSDVNFPVSSDERNNPKFTGCIDRSA